MGEATTRRPVRFELELMDWVAGGLAWDLAKRTLRSIKHRFRWERTNPGADSVVDACWVLDRNRRDSADQPAAPCDLGKDVT